MQVVLPGLLSQKTKTQTTSHQLSGVSKILPSSCNEGHFPWVRALHCAVCRPLATKFRGEKNPHPISQILMERKVYTQSDDIPALESQAAVFYWSWTGRNPTGLGRIQMKEEAKRRWRERESWVPGEAETLNGLSNMSKSYFLYKRPMILWGKYPQFMNNSSLSTTLRLFWSLVLLWAQSYAS